MCRKSNNYSRGSYCGAVRLLVFALLLLLLGSQLWAADWAFLKKGTGDSGYQLTEKRAKQGSQEVSDLSQLRSTAYSEQQKKVLTDSLSALEKELNSSKLITNELKRNFSEFVQQYEKLKKIEETEDVIQTETLNQLSAMESENAALADENAVLRDKVKKYSGIRRHIGLGTSALYINDEFKYSADATLGIRVKGMSLDLGAKYLLNDRSFSIDGLKDSKNYIFSAGIGFEF